VDPPPVEPDPVPPDGTPQPVASGEWARIYAKQQAFVTIMLYIGDAETPYRIYDDFVYFQIPYGLSPGVHEVRVMSGAKVLAKGKIQLNKSIQ
jgi:hypothetical protein